jgi:uncharacterized protein (TIGR03435 family)
MKVFGTGVCLLMLVSHAAAQSDTRPEFEVASIKPASPDARNVFIVPGPGGGVSLNNFTLKEMIVFAWRVQPFQISGGPPWLDSAHYDVVAKPETKPKQDEIPLMLQALLADRFQLVIHHDTKELPLFALTLARKDGKLGRSSFHMKARARLSIARNVCLHRNRGSGPCSRAVSCRWVRGR